MILLPGIGTLQPAPSNRLRGSHATLLPAAVVFTDHLPLDKK
jgi:hypothetical protein